MTPENKQRLKDAFTEAVNNSPFADEKIEGFVMQDGQPVTRRLLVEATLKMEEFYNEVDRMVTKGEVTIDKVIDQFRESMKKSFYGP